jgi:hypothetical protein
VKEVIKVKRYAAIAIAVLIWAALPRLGICQTADDHGISVVPTYRDPGLEIEVWTNKGKGGTFYLGEDLVVYFRTNADCYVLIYEVDTEGYLHVIYPHDPYEDCLVKGESTYRVPNPDLDYSFRVCGPQGEELIYAAASPYPVTAPQWLPYRSEGEYDPSWCAYEEKERLDLLDKVNSRVFEGGYFVSDWCVFEIENLYHHYYRPVTYYRYYPVGTVWVDCGWYGGEIFIDGVFWGYAPMCIPNILIGPHIIIIYYNGYPCWQRYVYVERYRPLRVRVDYSHKFERRRYKGDYFRDYDWGGKKYKGRPSWGDPESSLTEGKFTRRQKIGSKSTPAPVEKTTLAKSGGERYIRSKSVKRPAEASTGGGLLKSKSGQKRTTADTKLRTYKPDSKEKPKETKLKSTKSRTYTKSEVKKEKSVSKPSKSSPRSEKAISSPQKSTRTKVARRR